MEDQPRDQTSSSGEAFRNGRLQSWKEIAAYLKRDIRTVQRWEKREGLPIHRHLHRQRGSVHAFQSELDAWWRERGLRLDSQERGLAGTAISASPSESSASGLAHAPPGHEGLPQPLPAATARAPLELKAKSPARFLLLTTSLVLVTAIAGWLHQGSRGRPGQAAVSPPILSGRLLSRASCEGGSLKLIPVGTDPQAVVLSLDGATAYVSNRGDNTVSIVSTSSGTVTGTLAVGVRPSALALSPAGDRLYVGTSEGVGVIDTSSKTVRTIGVGGPVSDLALSRDGNKLYLAMVFRGLKKLTTDSEELEEVPTLHCPVNLTRHPGKNLIYVSYQCGGPGGWNGHDAVDVLDTSTDTFTSKVSGPPNVGSVLAVSPNGCQLWVNGGNACSRPELDHVGCPTVPGWILNVFRTSDLSLLRSLGFPQSEGAPALISFLPDSKRAIVGGEPTRVVDTSSMETVESLPLAASGSVVFLPEGRHAYAVLPGRNALAVLEMEETRSLPSGAVSLWTADGHPNDEREQNDGTLNGGAGYAAGRVGQAFQLDGVDDFVDLGDAHKFGDRFEFSLAVWVKLDGLASPRRNKLASSPLGEMSILDEMSSVGAPNRDGWRLLKREDGRFVFCMGGGTRDGCSPGSLTAVESRTMASPGRWVHLAVVKNPASLSLYVNGEHESSSPLGRYLCSNSGELRIGSNMEAGAFFYGLVDEIAYFDRALVPEEIRSLASGGEAAE